ncbi:hypothetical protein CIRMBP1230_01079 [Enterococcus cecorum]|uniref:helix-turn-helix domain-containing protein n=1 Tax=Enterococcus cecorum TaxID=44008 RepID=UPI00200A63C2|nr:helix-turn-helix transcriptional regulator [Enterococcus cecorum]CAI3298972.1 hypothetical protein CIRMBP1281_00659 [Enterococcus cecorum]CAI3300628.1 hypothetical protein CIRMBP1228_00651 [Enterococcus cecorum]CAI3313075.1 hypothetical protein CIRMBP1252_00809 [Enterococcus cecorum]CAI3323164.1 hypothetical protein CIRMBP1224_00890 [Enterococcus cecorum]CAI3328066.1 hypothetical protein CIRMBP1208_00762 [Enterococcus cecorum]
MSIGKRLRKLRERKGLSNTELASLIGATPTQVSRWESDKVKPNRYLSELMAFYGVTEGEITGKFAMIDLTQAMKANRLKVEDLYDGVAVDYSIYNKEEYEVLHLLHALDSVQQQRLVRYMQNLKGGD